MSYKKVRAIVMLLICLSIATFTVSCSPAMEVDEIDIIDSEKSWLDVGEEMHLVVSLRLVQDDKSYSFTLKDGMFEAMQECTDKELGSCLATFARYTVSYESSDSQIASVNDSGCITAIDPGTAIVTVTCSNDEDETALDTFVMRQSVQVVQSVQSLIVENSLELFVGDTLQIIVSVLPDNATEQSLRFASSDEEILTVDQEGLITALSEGSATVTVLSLDSYSPQPLSAEISVEVMKKTYQPPDTLPPDPSAPRMEHPEWQDELLRLVNEVRVQNGVPELAWSGSLAESAGVRTQEICIVFAHTRPDGSSCFTVNPLAMGENIAAGYLPSAQSVFNTWMNSAGHRENILRERFTIMGTACLEIPGSQYTYYWVQLFG